jgi:predicted aconitase with swiveling domain
MSHSLKSIRARSVTRGVGEGKVLAIGGPFTFAHGVEPSTGVIIDRQCGRAGENVKGRAMVFPYGRGSTTGSAWLLETVRRGNGPAAIINVETEPILVTGLIMARLLYNIQIPLVDRPEEDVRAFLEEDTVIQVNGDTGYVTVGK